MFPPVILKPVAVCVYIPISDFACGCRGGWCKRPLTCCAVGGGGRVRRKGGATMTTKECVPTLRLWLEKHEGDIAKGVDDFGDLRPVFKALMGHSAVHREIVAVLDAAPPAVV